jgi:hypothetical protein
MNKIKMMLLSLALFAVVGAALAFKARFQQDFCTAPLPQDQNCAAIACPNHAVSQIDPLQRAAFVCTTTYDNTGCSTQPQCTITTLRLTPND